MKGKIDRAIAATAAAIATAAVLALLPALSSGGSGRLVDKDSGTGKSPVAVATATVRNPGKLTFTISTKPANKKVSWAYTTDCVKDGEEYQYPPPGQAEDTISRSKVRKRMNKVVRNPDVCDVAVSGKLSYKSGKKITTKIFNK